MEKEPLYCPTTNCEFEKAYQSQRDEVERLNAQIDTVGSGSDPMMIELRNLTAENKRLEDVIKFFGLNALVAENKRLREAVEKFQHWHINNGLNNSCANCGLDLRNDVHKREALKDSK